MALWWCIDREPDSEQNVDMLFATLFLLCLQLLPSSFPSSSSHLLSFCPHWSSSNPAFSFSPYSHLKCFGVCMHVTRRLINPELWCTSPHAASLSSSLPWEILNLQASVSLPMNGYAWSHKAVATFSVSGHGEHHRTRVATEPWLLKYLFHTGPTLSLLFIPKSLVLLIPGTF